MVVSEPLCSVGERLKRARAGARLSWNGLAAATGLGRTTIAEIEAGKREPTRQTIWALARALGVEPAWLAGFTPDSEPAARAS
jgi:transcriptional regulator with XRE-family HTH domain